MEEMQDIYRASKHQAHRRQTEMQEASKTMHGFVHQKEKDRQSGLFSLFSRISGNIFSFSFQEINGERDPNGAG